MSKPKVKRKATLEEMLRMAREYREMSPGQTPEDIYRIRDSIHEEMSEYSNPSKINLVINEYGEADKTPGTVLIPVKANGYIHPFPGYVPVTDFGNNIISYATDEDNWVPEGYEGVYEAPIEYNDVYEPDFVNSFMFYLEPLVDEVPLEILTYPQVEEPAVQTSNLEAPILEDEEIEELDDYDLSKEPIVPFNVWYTDEVIDSSSDNDYPLTKAFWYDPSASYLNPRLEGVPRVNVPINRSITPPSSEPVFPEVSNEPPEITGNEYFPTTLNKSIYNPSLDYALELEPELNVDIYPKPYREIPTHRQLKRHPVYLPEEIFINMSDADKIKYEKEELRKKKSWEGLSQSIQALLDYAYELLDPKYRYLSPLVYPDIPKLGFYFDVKNRKYKRKKKPN